MRRLIFAVCILLSIKSQSQIPYVDSKEQLTNGVEFYKKGEYKKSIEQYKQVHECDTNYASAVYEEVLSLTADSSFEAAKALAIEGLKLAQSDKREFLLSLAAIYDYLQKSDSALVIYDSIARQYPNDHQPWYEEGILFFRKKQYDKALAYFQHSMMINPNHFESNYMLGMVYTMQGRLSEGMIAFEASLLMTQSTEMAKKAITILNSITEETDEAVKLYHDKAEQYSHPLFDELDQLVNSKLALSSDYKLKMSLNDNIFRQSQVILEKLKYDPKDTNFVMQFYVPMLTEVFSKDMFEPYILLLFSGYGFENVDNLAKKKKKEIDEVKSIVFPYLNKIQATRELSFTRRVKAAEKYHYYSKDNIIVIGTSIKRGDDEFVTGDAEILRSNHTLRSKGRYNNSGEKDGWWNDYYATGKLGAREFYVNNKEKDSSFSYYSNGNLKLISIRDMAGNAKAEYEYNYNGWLSAIRKKITDKIYEERSFYANGQLQLSETYDGENVKDGKYTAFHPDGKKMKEFSYKDGKYSGPFKIYYENGITSEEAFYEDGALNGPYLAHYESGQIKEKSAYRNGKEDGPYEKYYENGKMLEKGVNNKGKEEEVYKYSENGRLYGTLLLKGDVLYNIKYTDDDNKVMIDKEEKKGIYEYQLFFPNGNKSVDMKINDNGLRDGALTFYYSTGAKSEETTYKNGDIVGKSLLFYKDGKVKEEENYADDKRDGYFTSYYNNGTVSQEGWYKDGKAQGLWKSYYVNGKLRNEKYFLNDKIDGFYKEYNINGEPTNKYVYDYGAPVAHICYDTAGNKTDSVSYTSAYGSYKLYHWQNKQNPADIEYNMKYGNTEGLCFFRYVNGTKDVVEFYKEGNKDSVYTAYFPDGTLRTKGSFRNGDKIGKWEYFNEVGDLVREENYDSSGRYNGKVKTLAGKALHVMYNYKKGDKDGEQMYYGENGRVAFILYYDDGDFTGYTYEGKDGKMLPRIKVKNGTAKITAYYSNGQKSVEANIDQNTIVGSLNTYYSNGKIAEERNYKNFDLVGPFKRYNPDGKLAYEVNYVDDEENGVEYTYDANGKAVVSASYYYGVLHGPTIITDPATNSTKTYYYHYGELTNASR